jgi:Zn-dependent peptidase ImmA (M78 family)
MSVGFSEFDEQTHRDLRRNSGYARFTVPHEIAHLRLHLQELVALHELPHPVVSLLFANPNHVIYEDSEWQADRFAAAFLAPDEGLAALGRKGKLLPAEVAAVFGLSPQTAEYRISNYREAQRQRRGWRR